MKLLVSTLACAALMAGAACAQDRPNRDPDLNHDGKVTLSEFQAFQAQRLSRMLARYDTNQDGKISKAEFDAAAVKKDGSPRPGGGRMFELMDANHDGVVTRAEAEAAGVARFQKADLNHDGWLSSEEMAIAMPHMAKPK